MRALRGLALASGLLLLAAAPMLPADPLGEEGPRWLTGDWHLHSTRSHDACDPLTELRECMDAPYTLGHTPEQLLLQASLRGLDYFALTDHNLPPWEAPPDAPLSVLHSWEASVGGFGASGHAGVHGMPAYLERVAAGATPDARMQDYIRQVHDAGGAFVVNHPKDFPGGAPWGYSDATALQADAVEVWNIHWLVRSDLVPLPFPASDNPAAVRWWEGLLDQGGRLAAVGGSDSHWVSTSAIQGPGQPATWVHATEDEASIVAAMKAGRTFVTWDFTGPELHLEGDAGCDGTYDAMVGDTLGGAKACVRVRAPPFAGLVRVRAGGPAGAETLLDEPASPAGNGVVFEASGRTWVRAELWAVEQQDLVLRALTSPLYLSG